MKKHQVKFILPTSDSSASLPRSPDVPLSLNLSSVPSTEKQPPEESDTSNESIFAHRFRYLILFIGFFCLASINSNMIVFNFTLICFNKPHSTLTLEIHGLNQSNIQTDVRSTYDYPTYDFSQTQKSMLMWAVAVGSIVGTFPFNYLYAQFGARYVFFSAGIISAISTLLVPTAAEWGFIWFLGVRFIQGVAYSSDFAAIGVLCVRWASLKQTALFVSLLTCFSPMSSTITNPIAGALCESKWGWPSAYYFHGVVCLILFILWIIIYTDNPATHKAVSSIELEKIHRNKTEAHINMDSFVPYWQIIKNPVILTVWLNALCDIVSGTFLMTYSPMYLNNVLHYGVVYTGFLGSILALSHIPVKLISGYLSDKIKFVSEYKKMVFFNSLSLIIPGILYLAVGFVPDNQPMIAVLMFIVINALFGANCGGFYKCGILVSRQYSAFVVANIQFIKCLTLFIAPALVTIFVTEDSSRAQWRNIFILLGVLLAVSNAMFFFVATDEPAEFTKITRENRNQRERVSPL